MGLLPVTVLVVMTELFAGLLAEELLVGPLVIMCVELLAEILDEPPADALVEWLEGLLSKLLEELTLAETLVNVPLTLLVDAATRSAPQVGSLFQTRRNIFAYLARSSGNVHPTLAPPPSLTTLNRCACHNRQLQRVDVISPVEATFVTSQMTNSRHATKVSTRIVGEYRTVDNSRRTRLEACSLLGYLTLCAW